MIDKEQLKNEFTIFFGREPRLFRSPGRVNLIGEHTDYNGGFVLPMAINYETAVAIARRDDRKIRVHSINLNETAEFELDAEPKKQKGYWLNFIEGVAKIIERKGFHLSGADLLIWSDVPTGAGLSSSAALEVAVGFAFSEINNLDLSKTEIAKIGQQTEHEFVGAKVGIMDQFVSANALENHALWLDCRSLEFENVPLQLGEFSFVICDSNIKHDLATSEYNIRREQCEKGVEILRQFLPQITQLRDVNPTDLEKYQQHLPEIIKRRVRHVITENERTVQAVQLLKNNDLDGFGELLWQSHASLRDDYEVSCRELDLLVEIAQNCQGVQGARMTGGGFGGSTVNLVKTEFFEQFAQIITEKYQAQTNIKAKIFSVQSNNGVSEIYVK